MFSTKFLQASKTLMAQGRTIGASRNSITLRHMSFDKSDVDKCVGYGQKPLSKCVKKVATACRTPNASVKCVSLSIEVPCEKIRPPSPSFLEKLQAQDVFKLQKHCPNECCCLETDIIKNPLKISFSDIRHVEARC